MNVLLGGGLLTLILLMVTTLVSPVKVAQNSTPMLEGKKTYILAGLGIVVLVLAHFGIINSLDAAQILVLLGFGSAITLRSAMDKMDK